MADPATITMAAKAAATALLDERLRKTIGWTIGLILSPVINHCFNLQPAIGHSRS